ncbi:hypothetical protein H4R18_004625 [Coemansia javaensis]|uniref:Uncharacterized protein n=1 Tax=Coemansia javaensis TaxID=2761396 RepID=A0A9W8HBQ0_9FUNG|nr:hypothetical protein H4R18_004625 [Coemansia javaensis]
MPTTTLASDSGTGAQLVNLLAKKTPGRSGVTRRFTWDEVRDIVAANRLDLLGRTVADEETYSRDMERVRAEHGSVSAYVRTVKLADFIADAAANHLLILNDYPYALPADARHYILWSKLAMASGNEPEPAVREIFVAALDAQIGAGRYEWIWFVNPPELQSIPEVVHGHLIVRELGDVQA